jgi:Spy/CpxP family protein refolding chaperone
MRRVRVLAVVVAGAASLCAMNVAPAAACTDLADHGVGNGGDPGNGQEHHNESNGVGNIGDPGNAGGHFCPTDL